MKGPCDHTSSFDFCLVHSNLSKLVWDNHFLNLLRRFPETVSSLWDPWLERTQREPSVPSHGRSGSNMLICRQVPGHMLEQTSGLPPACCSLSMSPHMFSHARSTPTNVLITGTIRYLRHLQWWMQSAHKRTLIWELSRELCLSKHAALLKWSDRLFRASPLTLLYSLLCAKKKTFQSNMNFHFALQAPPDKSPVFTHQEEVSPGRSGTWGC